jgi:hypothetical protein
MHPSLLLIRIADLYLYALQDPPRTRCRIPLGRVAGCTHTNCWPAVRTYRYSTLVNFPVLLKHPPHPLAHSLDHPSCPCSCPVARLRARHTRSFARPLIRFHFLSIVVHLPVSPLACLRLHALFIVARLPAAHASTSPHLVYGCALAG